MKDRLTTAPLPMERPQFLRHLERAKRNWKGLSLWNSPQGFWNGPWPMERPQGFWNSRRLLERPLANGTRKALLERSPASWNARRGVSKKPLLHTRNTRIRGGNVEQSWCFRGETFVSDAISDECAAKVLLFSDMAMGWSGLRACAPMIGQSKKKK